MSAPVLPPSERVPPTDPGADANAANANRVAVPDVLLILGSRSLTRTRKAAWWTWRRIADAMDGEQPPGRIITGDSPGAMAVARSLAMSARVPFDSFSLDGLIYRPEGNITWHDAPVPSSRSWPLTRARAMIAAAWRAQRRGEVVRALILQATWSDKGGTRLAAVMARDAGLAVDWHECPAALGALEQPAAGGGGAP